MRTRSTLVAASLALVLGACTRSFPPSFPSSSAASPGAEEAPVAAVGTALREEPPLPGEPTLGWDALAPSTRPDGDHGASGGGHAHAH